MFKTPEWEDDVPKIHTSFLKKKKNKGKVPAETKIPMKYSNIKNKKLLTTKLNPISKVRIKQENKLSEAKTIVSKVNENKSNKSNKNYNQQLPRKRKLDNKTDKTTKKKISTANEITQNFDNLPETQNFDEIILNAKKKKINEDIENDDQEDFLFYENKSKKKKKKNKDNINDATNVNGLSNGAVTFVSKKKTELKSMLDNMRNPINTGNKRNQLRERMLERLKAAQFRYLNEKLYTSSGSEAQELFRNDPTAFETYHQGYQLQVKKWPVNPLDVIVKKIMKMPKSHLIADMGCGEAALSRRIPHTVRSFDLVASAPGVELCDMARTPLLAASIDVAVYCLALMGTGLTQYLVEANRVLKMGGHLLIAEVESRFDNVENFAKEVQRLGFKLKQLDKTNKVFYFMEFAKISEPPVKKAKLPKLTLRPCLYKRR